MPVRVYVIKIKINKYINKQKGGLKKKTKQLGNINYLLTVIKRDGPWFLLLIGNIRMHHLSGYMTDLYIQVGTRFLS